MKIQLINHLGADKDADIARIASACQKYVDLICKVWERAPIEVKFVTGATVADDEFTPMGCFSSLDVLDALGYHAVDSKGRPYGKAALSLVPNGEMLRDPEGHGQSLAGVVTHEVAEMIGDFFANVYAMITVRDPSSNEVYNLAAQELSDWVQNFAFQLKADDGTDVDCSDFVYPQFFNPDAPAGSQMSYMKSVTKQGEVAPGSYGIVAKETDDNQVFAKHAPGTTPPKKVTAHRIYHATEKPPAWRENLTKHPKSRSSKREAA